MSTYKSVSQVIQEIEYWLRLSVLLQGPLKNALLQVLHNGTNNPAYAGLPNNSVDLYNALSSIHLSMLNKLQKEKFLRKDQMELLLPTNDNKTHSDKFDITLIVVLIINCTTLPAPVNGWKTCPLPTDNSIAANVLRARNWRNFLNHANANAIVGKVFQQRWDDGMNIIKSLGYHSPDIKNLKTISLDPKHELVLQSLFFYINRITTKEQQHDKDLTTLQNQQSQHDKDLTTLQNRQSQHDKDLTTLQNRQSQHDKDLTVLQHQQSQHDKDLTALQNQHSQHDKDIGDLKKQISAQKDHMDQQDQTVIADNKKIDQFHKELNESVDDYGLLNNQLQLISKEVEHVKKLKLQDAEVLSNETADLRQICCREVLVYVANNIQDEWSQFLDLMSVPICERDAMKNNDKTSSENVMDYFKSIAYQVRWKNLHQILLALEKHQIVEYIETNTLITQGLQIASNRLKQQYIDDLLSWYLEQPLSDHNIDILREEGYIKLAILSSTTVDREWSNSDRETLMQQNLLQFEGIDIDKIFEGNDQMVVVRGVAGIGKSTLIQMYTLKWAKDEIINKVHTSSIDFLFTFTCREMNTFSDIESLEDLIRKKHPEVFDYVSFSDLQSISNRIMIIVDGLDELQGIYEDNSKPTFEANENISKLVKDIIDTKYNALKGHKTITLGRPKACEFIKEQFTGTQKIKTVEVCGFSNNMVKKYVDVFFKNDVAKAEKVLKVIRKSKDLKTMANVPIFLWVLCMVYGEELIDEEINTVTELYIYGFLVFLKNHLQSGDILNNRKLQCMANDPFVGEIVFSLAKLSMKTYMKHQVIFTDQDIKTVNCPIHLEQTGFIVKHSIGKMNIETYQFKHLAFQEFLCSLYLCLVKGASQFNTNRELSSCTPTIIGIYYLRKEKKIQLFVDLYQNLKHTRRKNLTLKDSLKAPISKVSHHLYIKSCLKTSARIVNFIGKNNILCLDFGDTIFQEFLRNIIELGYHFSKEHLKMVKDVSGVKVSFADYHAADKAMNALQLIETLQITQIDDFSYTIVSDQNHDKDNEQAISALWDLAIHRFKHNELRIVFSNRNFYWINSGFNPYHIRPEFWSSLIEVPARFTGRLYYLPENIKKKFERFVIEYDGDFNLANSQKDFLEDLVTYVRNNENCAIIIVSITVKQSYYEVKRALEHFLGEDIDKFVLFR